jgi:hypothetical protein
VDPAPSGGERDLVADPDRCAVAGPAGGVWVLADGVWPASDLVCGWYWDQALRGLRRGCDGDEEEWVVSVDSTSVRAHHHAAGARKAPPLDVSAERLAVAFVDDQREVVESADDHTGGDIELQESGG